MKNKEKSYAEELRRCRENIAKTKKADRVSQGYAQKDGAQRSQGTGKARRR